MPLADRLSDGVSAVRGRFGPATLRRSWIRGRHYCASLVGRSLYGRRICFLHFERCGGTSLRRALRDAYSHWFRDKDRVIKVVHNTASSTAAEGTELPVFAYRQQILRYLLEHPDSQLVTGHIQVDRNLVTDYREGWNFVTLLRHPVRRWLSHYYYNRFKKAEHGALNMSLEAYLETTRARALGRDYVDLLTGRGDYRETGDASGLGRTGSAEEAIEVLQEFRMVGTTERMGAFLDRLGEAFGVSLPSYRLNPNPADRDRDRGLSPDLEARLEEICAPNRKVYDYVRDVAR